MRVKMLECSRATGPGRDAMSWCLEFTDCLGFGVRVDCILPNPSGLRETMAVPLCHGDETIWSGASTLHPRASFL